MAEHEAKTPDALAAAAAPKGKGKLLKIGGILAVLVIVQCFLAYALLPKGEENTAHASPKSEKSEKAESASAESAKHAGNEKEKDQAEVDLGAFSLTVFNPRANNNLLIDFRLYGTVAASPEEPAGSKEEKPVSENDDSAKLDKMLKSHKNRFRDQVIMTVRNAQVADLADPGLGLLKRQILAKTNALLGEPLIKEIIFSDFVVVEQ